MMGRLFCIVRAMISYLFWNICSCPRSELRHGCCRTTASVFLRLRPQAHLQTWTEMATTCGTTLANPWSHIKTAPCQYLIALQQTLGYTGLCCCCHQLKTRLRGMGDTAGGQSSALLLLRLPPLPMGCRAGFPPWPEPLILGVTTFRFASLAEEPWASSGCHT